MDRNKLEKLYHEAVAKCEANDAWLLENYFAEAIIYKCADLAFDKAGSKAAMAILEHFGIVGNGR